jgi:hypothetical protein
MYKWTDGCCLTSRTSSPETPLAREARTFSQRAHARRSDPAGVRALRMSKDSCAVPSVRQKHKREKSQKGEGKTLRSPHQSIPVDIYSIYISFFGELFVGPCFPRASLPSGPHAPRRNVSSIVSPLQRECWRSPAHSTRRVGRWDQPQGLVVASRGHRTGRTATPTQYSYHTLDGEVPRVRGSAEVRSPSRGGGCSGNGLVYL